MRGRDDVVMDRDAPLLTITSSANPRIRKALALRQRSHRDETGRTLIEGCREIGSALDARHGLHDVFFCSDLFRGEGEEVLLRRCREVGVALTACTASVFAKLAYRDRQGGLVAVAGAVGRPLSALSVPAVPLLVVLESVEKPGNLGATLRSADAAGASAVVVCDHGTDVSNPNVIRSSVGTVFALPVIQTTTEELLPWMVAHGIRTVAATPEADAVYTSCDFRVGTAIVLGAEHAGLSARWQRAADVAVQIPMQGCADSLNVAAAATILLYEAVRQRSTVVAEPVSASKNGVKGTETLPS